MVLFLPKNLGTRFPLNLGMRAKFWSRIPWFVSLEGQAKFWKRITFFMTKRRILNQNFMWLTKRGINQKFSQLKNIL